MRGKHVVVGRDDGDVSCCSVAKHQLVERGGRGKSVRLVCTTQLAPADLRATRGSDPIQVTRSGLAAPRHNSIRDLPYALMHVHSRSSKLRFCS